MNYLQKTYLGTVLPSTTLTNAYSGGVTLRLSPGEANNVLLYLTYAMGGSETSNTVEFIIEGSQDGSTWFRRQRESATAGAVTVAFEEYTIQPGSSRILLTDIADKYIRVSFKETGVAANAGTISAVATLMTTR
jgi:hypothetical protein